MTASANFNPELSVIVPVYNVAPYLRKCLDSILNQTFKNIEIIIVSDGPEEDNKICAEYAAKDSRIIFIKDIGKGLGGARNAGIDIARGKYIAFVDSDDWLEPETYERALSYNKDSDIIIFEANIVNPEKENWQDIEKYSQLNFKGLQKLDNEHILNTNVFAWNKIFKKDIIKQHNIRFPENMQYEDFPFFFHYSFVSQKAFYLKERLYNYTQRKNSGMSKTTSGQYTHIIDHLNGCYFLFEILKKSNAIAKHEKLFAEIYAKWIEIGLGYCQKTDKLNFCKTAYKICKKMQLKNYSIPLLKLLKKKRFKDIIDGLKKEKILYLFNFLPILTIKHYPSQTKKIFLFGLLPLAKLKKAQYNQEDKPAKSLNPMFYENKVFWENERIYNLAPLEAENPFTKSKAPTKITEASLLKVPSVASPIPSYCDCITNGETGFLANTEKEWFDALSKLVEDKNLREKIAENSYNFVIKNFYINNRASEIVNTYKNIIQEQKNKQIKNNEPSISPIFNIKQLNIAFLIPAPFPNSGGHRNIFRAISHLKQSGHKLSVYYTGSDNREVFSKFIE